MTDDRAFRSRAVRGAGWVAADKWSNRLTGLLVLAVLGRLLSPADFGLVAIATGFMAFATVFVDQGFGRALVQRAQLTTVHTSTAFWTSVGSALVMTAIMVTSAPLLSTIFGGSSALVGVIQFMAVGLLLNALASTPAALLEREFRFRELAIRRFSGTVAGGGAAIASAFLGAGVWALVIQTLATATVGLITLWIASRWRPTFEFDRTVLRELWAVGGSIIGMELVGLLNSQADRLLIGAFLSPQTLGYYFLAMRVVSIMVELFSSVFSGVSLTTFSRLQDDRPRLLAWFYKLTSLSSTAAIPVFAFAAMTAPVILPFVFGEQWTASVPIMQILCFLGALNAVAYFDRSVLIAVGRARSAFRLTLGQSVLGIVLELISLPFGVIAVAVAVTLRQYVYWPIRLITLHRNVGVDWRKYLLQWFRPFAVSLVAVVASLLVNVAAPRLDEQHPVLFVAINALIAVVAFGLGTVLTNRTFFTDLGKIARRRF